jgi:hypothetical protein
MRFVDVCGPPGCGKSTLCYPLWGDKSVVWDGYPLPAYWKQYTDELTNLFSLIDDHPSIQAVQRMNIRTAGKMATVERMPDDDCFIQTGHLQRIFGFGWRLHHLKRDIRLISRALWLMPVSVGVVFLECSPEILRKRNKDREKNAATAHENRWFQCPHMLPCIDIAKEILEKRGVPVKVINTEKPLEEARDELVVFSKGPAFENGQPSPCDNDMATMPIWWQSAPVRTR